MHYTRYFLPWCVEFTSRQVCRGCIVEQKIPLSVHRSFSYTTTGCYTYTPRTLVQSHEDNPGTDAPATLGHLYSRTDRSRGQASDRGNWQPQREPLNLVPGRCTQPRFPSDIQPGTARLDRSVDSDTKFAAAERLFPPETSAKTPMRSKGRRHRKGKKLYHLSSTVKYARKSPTFPSRQLLIRGV